MAKQGGGDCPPPPSIGERIGDTARRGVARYDSSSKFAKRSTVGGSAIVFNFAVGRVAEYYGLSLPTEVVLVIGGGIASAIGWVAGGGVSDLIIAAYEFRRRLREYGQD